jgi:4-hydroxybenzoyl-CoA thioesterase/acyl-CoA thioester hydrolase
MSAAFVTTRRVEFSDTDAAGIMHFAAFFRMMEQAEHELLRSVGLSVVMHDKTGKISWPRVSAKCDYQSVARFEELLEIEVRVARLGKKSVTYRHRFSRDGEPLAMGEITAVCCRVREGAAPKSMPIPAALAKKLQAFVVSASAAGE